MRVLPAGLGRPIWIDDDGFDIRAHVQELVLPQHRHSGYGRRVLLDLVGDWAGRSPDGVRSPRGLVVSVPVSARRGTTPGRLGNETGVRPIAIPIQGDPFDLLGRVAPATRAAADRAEGARGASAAPLLAVFRGLARVGLLRWFIDHQRRVRTFVTNVRGPADPLELLGQRITEIVPVAISPGNVGVTFDVLSYAGGLVVTVVADPTIAPDHEQIADELLSDLLSLSRSPV